MSDDLSTLPLGVDDGRQDNGAKGRKPCRKHDWYANACRRCGVVQNPVLVRRGRTSLRAGKDAERLVERLTGLTKVGEFGTAVDVGDAASWAIGQVKAGHRYSAVDEADLDRMASEAHGRPRLLFKVKRPGPGHARRVTVTLRLSEFIAEHGDALVTLDMPDWRDLHG